MVLIGDFLTAEGNRSLLYDPSFSHGYRTSQGDGSRGWSK
jgi:precorrin-4 methylase